MINEFKKITGVGVLLNTSFNLHVNNRFLSKGCDKTLKKSGLKYLFLEIILLKNKMTKIIAEIGWNHMGS